MYPSGGVSNAATNMSEAGFQQVVQVPTAGRVRVPLCICGVCLGGGRGGKPEGKGLWCGVWGREGGCCEGGVGGRSMEQVKEVGMTLTPDPRPYILDPRPHTLTLTLNPDPEPRP